MLCISILTAYKSSLLCLEIKLAARDCHTCNLQWCYCILVIVNSFSFCSHMMQLSFITNKLLQPIGPLQFDLVAWFARVKIQVLIVAKWLEPKAQTSVHFNTAHHNTNTRWSCPSMHYDVCSQPSSQPVGILGLLCTVQPTNPLPEVTHRSNSLDLSARILGKMSLFS